MCAVRRIIKLAGKKPKKLCKSAPLPPFHIWASNYRGKKLEWHSWGSYKSSVCIYFSPGGGGGRERHSKRQREKRDEETERKRDRDTDRDKKSHRLSETKQYRERYRTG